MKNNKYKVTLYYSGYSTQEVKAKNKEEAVLKARKMNVNTKEIVNTLESWKEADEAEKI